MVCAGDQRAEVASQVFSAIAIETSLALRLVFHQPLRRTQGPSAFDRGSCSGSISPS